MCASVLRQCCAVGSVGKSLFHPKIPSFTTNFTDSETNTEVTVEYLMIDTVIAASIDGHYSAEMVEEWPHLDQLPQDAPSATEQWAWIEQTLAASTADYIWVGGHYPVWTGCSHAPTPVLVEKLKPLLEKYHATGEHSIHLI